MTDLRQPRSARRCSVLLAALLLVTGVLGGCGTGGDAGESGAWQDLTPTIESPLPDLATGQDTQMPSAMGDLAPPAAPVRSLTTNQLLTYAPNELGVIPVLQYHVFVTDPDAVDDFTVTIDTFNEHLRWLYEHDFYVIPLSALVRNEIAAPPGKHPVVLTFDDGSAGQFRFLRGSGGTLVPDPKSAIGAMEAFFASHPDFGRGGAFAVLPFNCFAEPTEPEQMPYCDQKLAWLAEHGYEVVNHTSGHQDLLDVSDERFVSEVGGAVAWIDEHVPEPANQGRILVVPYGNYPDADLHPEQRRMLREGFEYEGETVHIEAALMVGANPAESPSSTLWDPIWIPRVQTSDTVTDYWFTAIEDGEVILYVSDGNARTVTVPDPLPTLLEGEFDPELVAGSGKELIRYAPQSRADR